MFILFMYFYVKTIVNDINQMWIEFWCKNRFFTADILSFSSAI